MLKTVAESTRQVPDTRNRNNTVQIDSAAIKCLPCFTVKMVINCVSDNSKGPLEARGHFNNEMFPQ